MSQQVLIIDEVSMISAELFHLLEGHMRQLRHNDQPFGGVQLVLAGDYFQCALLWGLSEVQPKVRGCLRLGGGGQRSLLLRSCGLHINERCLAAALHRGGQSAVWLVSLCGLCPGKCTDACSAWSMAAPGSWARLQVLDVGQRPP